MSARVKKERKNQLVNDGEREERINYGTNKKEEPEKRIKPS